MARMKKVCIELPFDPLLVHVRRCVAPHAVYDGGGKYWKVPAAEAAAFLEQADRMVGDTGRSVTILVDWKPVTLGVPAVTAAPVLAPVTVFQPSI